MERADVLKRITYLEKKHDLDFADFSSHWRTTHADIARDLPGVACYLQNHLHLAEAPDSATEPFRIDGIVELWFHEPDVVSAASDSDVADRLIIDEQRFLAGLTGGPVRSAEPHEPWPYKLWVLGHWAENTGNSDALHTWAESLSASLHAQLGINVNELEPAEDLLIRQALRHEPRIPQVALAFGFISLQDAQMALPQVRSALGALNHVVNAHLYLGSEEIIVAPELAS